MGHQELHRNATQGFKTQVLTSKYKQKSAKEDSTHQLAHHIKAHAVDDPRRSVLGQVGRDRCCVYMKAAMSVCQYFGKR